MARLQGKVALVTGAARGIGLAVAEAFVREGATVWLTDIEAGAVQTQAQRLGQSGLKLDVREEADWALAMNQVMAQSGRLDILVNNAGISGLEQGAVHDPEHASLTDWRAVMAVNLDGVFLGCRAAIRAMRTSRAASIVNISSRSGVVGIPLAAAYAASKAAVRNHSKTVALYCAQQGLPIRCNSIHPAAILTPLWEPMLGQGSDREARMAACVVDTPLRRFGTPAEVAAAVVFLASDESAYMTGTELHVDGGILAGAAGTPGR